MADILDKIAAFQKAHDYFGKANDVLSSIETVRKASKIDPKNPRQLEELVGITDKETQKLLKVLNARMKAAEDMVKASFPEVESGTFDAWTRWAKAIDKYGEDSPQAQKGREIYVKALEDYDYLLHERTSYCDLLVKLSTKQSKIYRNLVELHANAEKLCLLVIATPGTMGTGPQTAAMQTILKFRGVAGPAKRIYKAHDSMVRLARAEKTRAQKLRDENLVWLNDMREQALTNMLKKAMRAFGIAA